MTHAEWVAAEVDRLRRECGVLERTYENVALVGMMCIGDKGERYQRDVGETPPARLDHDVIDKFWDWSDGA